MRLCKRREGDHHWERSQSGGPRKMTGKRRRKKNEEKHQ
jgi:hypothetical protein